MPRIILDFDPPQADALGFTRETSDLVYFLSWAYSARFGASHELSQVALILRGEFKIDLQPLLTFADRDVEDADDEAILERSWQDAQPLAECCDAVAGALASDNAELRELIAEYPGLQPAIEELGVIAARAGENGARIRITYLMEDS